MQRKRTNRKKIKIITKKRSAEMMEKSFSCRMYKTGTQQDVSKKQQHLLRARPESRLLVATEID